MTRKEKTDTTSKKVMPSSNKTESYYHAIFEQSPDGMLIIDAMGKIIEFNEAACRHLGYTREEFSKLGISDIDSDQTPEEMDETIKRILKDGRAEFEVRQRTKKGDIRNVRVITQVINLSGLTVLNSIWKDITDQRRADAALQESEKLYRLLAENSTDMVTRHLLDSTYLYVSPACRTLFGYEPEELMGTKAFDQMHPEDVNKVITLTQEAIKTGGTNMGQYRHRKKDGRYIWVETVGKVIKNAETGNVEDIICVVRDITERKRAEEELRKLNRTLLALNNSSHALRRAKDEDWYLNEICRIVVEDCGHTLVWIGYAEEDDRKTVRPVAFAGFDEGYIKSLDVTWADTERGRGPVGTAIRTGAPTVFRNMLSDPRFAPWREDALKRGYAAAVGLPLLADGKAFGSLTIYSRHPDPFSDEELRLLADLAADLAYGINSIRSRTAHAKAEDALRESEEHYRTLFDNMLNGYAYCKMLYENGVPSDFIYLDVNPAFEKLTGLKDVVGRKISEAIPGIQETDPELFEIYGRVALTGMPERIETYLEALDMWFSISVYSPRKEHFVVIFEVITERKRAEEELHDNFFAQSALNMILSESLEDVPFKEFLQKALNMILSVPWIAFESTGSISLVEDEADVLVMKAQSNLDEPSKKLCARVPFGKCLCGKAAQSQNIEFADHVDERYEICYKGIPPHGQYSVPLLFSGKTLGVLNIYLKEGHIRDKKEEEFLRTVADTLAGIIMRKNAEERIEYLAYYDGLTSLPNRKLFIDRLKQGVARAERTSRIVAVLITDIDRFKSINDTYGTEVGDKVLNDVAERLSTAVRKGDTIARLGNDEFGIALLDITSLDDVVPVMEKIMKNISHPLKIGSDEVTLTFSTGISIYPHDNKNPQDLLKNAELALVVAKREGRKTCQFYTEDLNIKASEFILMEKNLCNAVQNEEFILHYQPYWDITTRKMVGMEALVRWQSKDKGLIPPGKFIPVLEDTGMIIEVGEWILREAMRQAKEWQNNGYPVVPISVNLSLIQFRQKDLAGMMKKIMKDCGVSPSLLTLEITESAFMLDIGYTKSVLTEIKEIGCSVSVDDFGTGYSSLSYLKRLPIDNLKIDMSFIREIVIEPDSASIVMAIINMAHTLQLKTIAEGIETEEQWKFLRLLRCDMGQGFYLSKPLPAEEVERFFKP